MFRLAQAWTALGLWGAAAGAALAAAAPGPPPAIVLITGTVSVPEARERNYAQTVARRLSRWLGHWGVAHRVLTDEEAAAGLPAEARWAILPYNPQPPPQELAALRRFAEQGGKLMVFYGADSELAAALGMRLGPYAASDPPGRWRAMRFAAAAPPHVPPRVTQASRNIRPALAVEGRSRVIAVWEDAEGRPLPDPAWTWSERGVWMSHVLLDDGDTPAKQRMLLALLASELPAVWRAAAETALSGAQPLGRFRNLDAALCGVAAEAGAAPRAGAALARARALLAECRRSYGQGRYAESVEKIPAIRAALIEAYAAAQTPRPGERRGVWDHSGMGLFPGDWPRTAELLAAQGVTDIFPNLLWAGWAHYPSAVLPLSDIGRLYGDQLRACVAAAHARGLRVHVWKVCWRVDGARPELLARLRSEGRLQRTETGAEAPWLCPSQAENQRWEKDAVRELLRLAEVDGVHLDYARYRDGHVCYCPACRAAFEQQLGRRVNDWPAEARRWPLKNDYAAWRCRQINRLVQDVSAIARAANPRLQVSAAVFGKYPSCVEGMGQDWVAWLREGWVDFVCPMNYTEDLETFTSLVRGQTALPGAQGRILPGIGVTAAESRLDGMQALEQVAAVRQAGAPGFVLFDLNRALAGETLPLLRLGAAPQR